MNPILLEIGKRYKFRNVDYQPHIDTIFNIGYFNYKAVLLKNLDTKSNGIIISRDRFITGLIIDIYMTENLYFVKINPNSGDI